MRKRDKALVLYTKFKTGEYTIQKTQSGGISLVADNGEEEVLTNVVSIEGDALINSFEKVIAISTLKKLLEWIVSNQKTKKHVLVFSLDHSCSQAKAIDFFVELKNQGGMENNFGIYVLEDELQGGSSFKAISGNDTGYLDEFKNSVTLLQKWILSGRTCTKNENELNNEEETPLNLVDSTTCLVHLDQISTVFDTMIQALKDQLVQSCSTHEFLGLCKTVLNWILHQVVHDDQSVQILNENEVYNFGKLVVSGEEYREILSNVLKWEFCAFDHDKIDMIKYCLVIFIELAMKADLRISLYQLVYLICTMIQGYLDNPYHNLWHAVDTCQSTFYILHILDSQDKASPLSVNADILNPMDRFVLILSCLGHDLGHPGLTNKLMSDTNSPLSILFNDQSILENYHLLNLTIILSHVDSLTAGSDLANIYAAKNKELAISIILATDMARHSQYVDLLRTRAEILDRKNANASGSDYSVPSSKHSSVSWLSADSFEDKKLLCALIMKCSDISNTARPFKISERWAIHFSDEMSNQTKFECSLGLASLLTHDTNSNSNSTLNSNDGSCENQLVGRNEDCNTATNLSGLSSSQVVFYNTFSIPLFKAAGDLIPALSFMYKQSLFNCETWKNM